MLTQTNILNFCYKYYVWVFSTTDPSHSTGWVYQAHVSMGNCQSNWEVELHLLFTFGWTQEFFVQDFVLPREREVKLSRGDVCGFKAVRRGLSLPRSLSWRGPSSLLAFSLPNEKITLIFVTPLCYSQWDRLYPCQIRYGALPVYLLTWLSMRPHVRERLCWCLYFLAVCDP